MAHRVLADAASSVELTQNTTAVGIILQQTVRRSLTNRMFAFYRRHIHKTATFIVLHLLPHILYLLHALMGGSSQLCMCEGRDLDSIFSAA